MFDDSLWLHQNSQVLAHKISPTVKQNAKNEDIGVILILRTCT